MKTCSNRITGNCVALLLLSTLLSSCSDDGSEIILDQGPEITIGLPAFLNADFLVIDNIRPNVALSGVGNVSMNNIGSAWSGTINVIPDRTYEVTVTWIERIGSDNAPRDLPLATLTQTLTVNADGTASQTNTSAYDTDIDSDADGVSNLQERQQGTDPFSSDLNGQSVAAVDDPGAANPEGTQIPANVDAAANSEPDENTNVAVAGEGEATVETANGSDDPVAGDTGIENAADGSGTDSEPTQDSTQTDSDLPDEETPLPAAIADVIVPRISAARAPEIDGSGVRFDLTGRFTGEWAGAVQQDINGLPLHINHLMIDRRQDTEVPISGARWAALHDGEYLYVVVTVDDNQELWRDSGSNLFNDDSLELFIDGDNSKTAEYDDNDFHVLIPMLDEDDDEQGATTGAQILGPNSSSAPLDLDFVTGPASGPAGAENRQLQDVYELKLDIGSAGINPDEPLGFELQINDDDDGRSRDTKTGWHHPERETTDVDGTYRDASIMGTIKLE